MPAGTAEDGVEGTLHKALVPLPTDGRHRQRAVVGRVVADRGVLRLSDRHLQPYAGAHRDHLRIRLRLRRREIGDRKTLQPGCAAAAEGREEHRDHEDDREQGEERESPDATRAAHLPTFDAPPPGGA